MAEKPIGERTYNAARLHYLRGPKWNSDPWFLRFKVPYSELTKVEQDFWTAVGSAVVVETLEFIQILQATEENDNG